jgi:Subtilase family
MDPKEVTNRGPDGDRGLDCAGRVKALTEQGERRAEDMRRRFRNTARRYHGRHDLAWWPADPDKEPLGPEGFFFYRPGQLLVRDAELEYVECVLSGLGVESCARTRREKGAVTRLVVATPAPTPLLVRQLRRLGLGSQTVSLNHVWWPATGPAAPGDFTLDGAPWLSGGAESAPEPAVGEPDLAVEGRGAGVTVAVFDSALLADWSQHPWMCHVDPFDPVRDVDVPDAGSGGGPVLDIYDSHGVAVAGVVAARAPAATVRVRDVLNELGDVDEWSLIDVVRSTLRNEPGIDIVNLSLGGTTSDDQPPIELGALLDEFPGVIFVAAAGNNGLASTHPVWPAAFDGVIGVGALGAAGNGRAPFSNPYPSADVWAPGTDVLTAFGSGPLDYDGATGGTFTGMAIWSGTSFAAPYVSGVLCEYLAAAPGSSGPASTGAPSRTVAALNWLNANAHLLRQDTSGDQIRV